MVASLYFGGKSHVPAGCNVYLLSSPVQGLQGTPAGSGATQRAARSPGAGLELADLRLDGLGLLLQHLGLIVPIPKPTRREGQMNRGIILLLLLVVYYCVYIYI